MTVEEIFALWRAGFGYDMQITLLASFIPAVLGAVWTLWDMAR